MENIEQWQKVQDSFVKSYDISELKTRSCSQQNVVQRFAGYAKPQLTLEAHQEKLKRAEQNKQELLEEKTKKAQVLVKKRELPARKETEQWQQVQESYVKEYDISELKTRSCSHEKMDNIYRRLAGFTKKPLTFEAHQEKLQRAELNKQELLEEQKTKKVLMLQKKRDAMV